MLSLILGFAPAVSAENLLPELADLESRLAALQLPLRERILICEKRITELEKDLANRGEEMRELIRATLSLVRARLEEEKTKVVLGNGAH